MSLLNRHLQFRFWGHSNFNPKDIDVPAASPPCVAESLLLLHVPCKYATEAVGSISTGTNQVNQDYICRLIDITTCGSMISDEYNDVPPLSLIWKGEAADITTLRASIFGLNNVHASEAIDCVLHVLVTGVGRFGELSHLFFFKDPANSWLFIKYSKSERINFL